MKNIRKHLILLLAAILVFSGLGFGTHSTSRAEAADADAELYNLKLMTFNIRNGGSGEEADWMKHRDIVIGAIESFRPDVLGMQEGHQSGIEYLLNNLQGDYASIGTSRYGNTTDEYNNIVYDAEKFDVVQWGQFWLSETPDLVGSKSSFDSTYPRMVTWARFKAKDNPQAEFYYFNTHFGLIKEAQVQAASVILDRIDKIVISPDTPVFLGGDFNVDVNSDAFQALEGSSLSDTWAASGKSYGNGDGTYSNFEGLTDTGHIDWIFQRNMSNIESIEINRYTEDGVYPSDHYPVQLVVNIPLTGRIGATVPGAPSDVYAAVQEGITKVAFTPSSEDGGSEVLQYKVTVWQDGNIFKTVEGDASPISVTGLDATDEYMFTVSAINAEGESDASIPAKPIYELANTQLGKPYLEAAVSNNGWISGKITITPTNIPVDEQEYVLYWGDADGKLSDVQPIAMIPAGEGDVSYTFDKTSVPSGATAVLVYTRILGFDSTQFTQEKLPSAGVQPKQIEDFTDVSDWTDLRYGKIEAVDGIAMISVDGPAGRPHGYAGIPVTYNLTDLPILHIKVEGLNNGALWALKLHTKPLQGSGDIKIQGDTDGTGEFNFDLRKATGWSGDTSFIIKLFSVGVDSSFRISELSAHPAVDLDIDEAEMAPIVPSGLIATARDASVELSWNSSADADQYEVYKYEGTAVPLDPAEWQLVATNVTSTAYTVTNLVNDTSYTFAVKAVNAAGESDYSAAVMATPKASQVNNNALKVISFNVLTSSNQPIDLKHDGKTRGEMLIELIDNKQPDSMGLNEVTQDWLNYVTSNVVDYAYQNGATYAVTGNKAEDGTTDLKSGYDEYSPILYRSDLYDVAKTGGFWFSATPDDKTTMYSDIKDGQGNVLHVGMSKPRVISYAVFKNKETDDIAYIHVNSHFDHKNSDYIKQLCTIQLIETANKLADEYGVPVILTGDINATEQTDAYKMLANGQYGYLNAKYVTNEYSTLPSSAGFGTGYNEGATDVIDHIFISAGNIGVYKHDIIKNPYLSDHSAVYAELSLNQMPKLDAINVNDAPIAELSADHFSYELYLPERTENTVIFDIEHDAGYTVSANPAYTITKESEGRSQLSFDMMGENSSILLYVSDSEGRTTTYTFNIYQESGEANPIISEIFPNAIPGYKYFEVTNSGTKSMNTDDYAFLWGNIGETSVSWESVLEVSENRVIRPGASVVFWFTHGGTFTGEPTVADFNAHYYTSLTEDDIITFDTSQKFIGYSVSDTDPNKTETFTMGANKGRGMRIAYTTDSDGQPYGWKKKTTNSEFNGPTVSVSSYHSIAAVDLTQNQLFKFKYVDGQTIAAASDVLGVLSATPGVYDERIGNEPKGAYARIEAGLYDAFSVVHAEGENMDNLGGSMAGSWAFYSNVDFGESGAGSVTFSAAVKESNASGNIEIYLDGGYDGSLTGAKKIGFVTTTPTAADWSVFEDFTGSLTEKVTGKHHVTLVFVPNAGKTYVANLDYFTFNPYEVKEDITELTEFTFKLDGEALTENTELNATQEKRTYTMSAAAQYSPADADFSLKWSSSDPTIATINEATGAINVLRYGDFTIQASVYSNYKLIESYTSPILSTNYKISAFSYVEGEWASSFTANSAGNIPSPAKAAAAATGMSSNLTNGANYISGVVGGSSITINSVDFGNKGIKGFIMNLALKPSSSGGTVTVYADTVDDANKIGHLISSIADTEPEDYNTYLKYTGTVEQSVTGVHDIILVMATAEGKKYVGNIDYIIFEELETSPVEGVDTVKPVITLLGDEKVTVKNGAAYLDAGVVASDDQDGNITDRVVTTVTINNKSIAKVNTKSAGTYIVHYNVQDAAGNAAVEITRTVIVKAPINSGNDDTTNTPATPSASDPELPTEVQQLGKTDLKSDGTGSFTVQWNKDKEVLLLPADVASTIEESDALKLQKESLAFELSGQTLQKLLAQAGEGVNGAQLRITAEAADSKLIERAVEGETILGAIQWTAASGVYNINVDVVNQHGEPIGTTSALDHEKIVLSIETDNVVDPELLGVYIIGADGKLNYVGGEWRDGKITVEIVQGGQYAVLTYTRSFEDVDDSHWAKTVIARMAAKHIINGVDDARFEPQRALTRAEFATMLVRLLGITQTSDHNAAIPFADVPQESWYAAAIDAAVQAGLVTGLSNGNFEPESTITRQEMAIMLVRAYTIKTGHQLSGSIGSEFADADQISAWAKDAVAAAEEAGLLQGRGDGRFAPQEQLTRAESVQALYNLLKSLD